MSPAEGSTLTRNAVALAGLALFIGGIAAWSKPAAAIVLGLLLMVYVYVTSR